MSESPLYIEEKDQPKEEEEEMVGQGGPDVQDVQDSSITLELGDIIEIQAPSNPELNLESFFITYLDDAKIDLTNISTFRPYSLRLDADGRITDESIQRILLLSRSEELGYARQHLLLPKTWVDIHFGGEVPTIITGEITNLEEDMIEITTYPDVEVIYLDFEYKGLPEHIPLDQIVIRTKPASLEKIASLIDVRESLEEGEIYEPGELLPGDAGAASIEWTETGEAVIKLPKSVRPDQSVRDALHGMYVAANEIVYGEELEELVQRVEIPEYQKRYGIETQVNDMLDELLSEIPNARRTKAVLDNIHLLIERFRELRTQFSKFDSNGNVQDVRTMGPSYKPLVEAMTSLNAKLRWLVPVVALRRKIYTSVHPETISDVIQSNISEILGKDQIDQEDYLKNRMRGDVPAYGAYYGKIAASQTPVEPPLFPENYLAPKLAVSTVPLDAIVQNLEDFYSTVLVASKDTESYVRRRFVTQRYSLGETKLAAVQSAKTGRRVYVRDSMTPDDTMTVGSMMVLPIAARQFTLVDLPGTSILKKSGLSQNYMYLFRLLSKRRDVQSRVIRQFGENLDKENWEDAEQNGTLLRTVQEFVLDESLDQDPRRYRQFLEAILPTTNTAIELITKYYPASSLLSVKRLSQSLEPFLIYSRDLNYQQYNHIRFFVKTQIKEYRKTMVKRGDEMAALRSTNYGETKAWTNQMEKMFFEKRELFQLFTDAYRFRTGNDTVGSPEEWISRILHLDDGRLFADLIRLTMVSLVTPESLGAMLEKDEMSDIGKIKATDCQRRVLTKKYSSIQSLQKDNGESEVYYDQEFDDTPYEIAKKYKDDQKKYDPEDYLEFLAESLVQKHDCPPKMSKEVAAALIAGKKLVREGEYALVELRPQQLHADSDLTALEKRKVEDESDIRKRILYYRRVKNQWVHDDSLDETAFIDNNTLFCNMNKICFRDTKSKVCEPVQDAEARMRNIARKRMIGEFGDRFAASVETIQDELKGRVDEGMRRLSSSIRLSDIQRHKYNNLAFELGRFAKTEDVIQSPYVGLRDQILGQDDFAKRQSDLVRFVELYCRDPMVAELGESQYWLYCQETNTPLLPSVLAALAKTFVSGEDYAQKQAELCRIQGILSEDGDSIVDRFSGYVIRKIDFVEEQGYDEAGFRVLTGGLLEKDLGAVLLEASAAGAVKSKERVFENETSETVYKVYKAISTNIGLPLDAIEEFVLRVSLELIAKNITSENVYQKMSEKMEKDKGKRPPPYKSYRNQTILMIVAAVILVGIQTATPSFKIRKTFPGCVQSFRGYPENGGGVEDMTGLQYLACVLNKTKSSIAPWDSIQRIPLTILQDRIRKILETLIIPRPDLMELYAIKREYILLHPEEDIPTEHAIQRWTGFLPPVVPFTLAKSLTGLSNDFKQELLTMMRNGNREQREQIAMFKTKCTKFGYGVIESIRTVVRSKDLLLKTASSMYFMENACCNDKNTARVLDYFIAEDDTLAAHIKMVEGWETVLSNVREISRASMIYDPKRTGIQYPSISTEHNEENIYAAFIWYCNLDREMPIPEEMRGLMAEKMAEYNPRWTMPEKIEFFKQNGKRFTFSNLNQLMDIVNRQNMVQVAAAGEERLRGTRVSALREFLEHLDGQETSKSVVEAPLRKLLEAVLVKFNPRAMISEDSEETRRLNNYLTRANEEMLAVIANFFQAHGNLSARKFTQLQEMLADIHMWNLENVRDETSMYTVTQFMQNSINSMTRVYPEILRNNHFVQDKTPKHWGLSANHEKDVSRFLKKYYEPLQRFKNDPVLLNLLTDTQMRLADLNTFLSHIPAFTPIHRTDQEGKPVTFYSLFDKRTVYMLHTYTWYSVLYEYIMATDDATILQTDIQERKEERRQTIRENADTLAPGMSEESLAPVQPSDMDPANVNAFDADVADDLMEMQIVAGDKKDLKIRVAEMLLAFLEIDGETKRVLDYSYEDLEKRIGRSRQEEKRLITDFLRDLDPEERRVEDMKKSLKLGRWNVGMQKGLVQYDKGTYERERSELVARLNGELDEGDDVDTLFEREVADLEAEADADADADADREAMDIGGLSENYNDGEYYDEDVEGGDDFGREY